MDKLTDEERILAWKASWHPSFSGKAIVDKDFTFRSVNPQFCKLLGVTPAELIGSRFQDVTPPGVRELDQKNAELVAKGDIDFYMIPKRYQFSDRRVVDVVLLVNRAPSAENGDFQFFLSQIMLDENGKLLKMKKKELGQQPTFPKSMKKVVDFMMKYGTWMAGIGTIIATILLTLKDKFYG